MAPVRTPLLEGVDTTLRAVISLEIRNHPRVPVAVCDHLRSLACSVCYPECRTLSVQPSLQIVVSGTHRLNVLPEAVCDDLRSGANRVAQIRHAQLAGEAEPMWSAVVAPTMCLVMPFSSGSAVLCCRVCTP